MKISLEKEIKDLDAEIKLRKSEAKKMMNLKAKVKAQRVIKEMKKSVAKSGKVYLLLRMKLTKKKIICLPILKAV